MNPSSPGWILKLGKIIQDKNPEFSDANAWYDRLRSSGFVYGINVRGPHFHRWSPHLSRDEKAKLNLVTAQYAAYWRESGSTRNFEEFTLQLTRFYEELERYQAGFFDRLFPNSKHTNILEKHVHQRVLIEGHPFFRNFEQMVTNTLLYVDVLSFQKFLSGSRSVKEYAAMLESHIMGLSSDSLAALGAPEGYEQRLSRLIQGSLQYVTDPQEATKSEYLSVQTLDAQAGKYLTDVLAMVHWDQTSAGVSASTLQTWLDPYPHIDGDTVEESVQRLQHFFSRYPETRELFTQKHPLATFYDNSQQLVRRLILRNRDRLKKELSQSRELLNLLGQSTRRDLTSEEKRRLKRQLTDLFKTIPSLAIFALPGGAILLPLFVKLIPDLLPSAFDDNTLEE